MTALVSRLSPIDALIGTLYWQLAALGGCLIAEAVVGPSSIYDTFRAVAPPPLIGAVLVGVAHFLLLAHLRQRRLVGSKPLRVRDGRLQPQTRALYYAGLAAAVCFLAVAVAYLVQFDWAVTTAQAMYLPASVGALYVATEGQSPWS